MTEERVSAATPGSSLEAPQQALSPVDTEPLQAQEDATSSAVEIVEQDNGEDVDETVINIPLAIAFFLGGIGFLTVLLVSTASGTHLIMGLLWSSLTFVTLSVIGYLTDALIEFPGIAPTEIPSEEDADLVEDLADEGVVASKPDEPQLDEPQEEGLIGTEIPAEIPAEEGILDQNNAESETTPTI